MGVYALFRRGHGMVSELRSFAATLADVSRAAFFEVAIGEPETSQYSGVGSALRWADPKSGFH
jgi:hypothetical protein